MSVNDSLTSRARLTVAENTYLYHSLAKAAEQMPCCATKTAKP